jgi:hypothetical protein
MNEFIPAKKWLIPLLFGGSVSPRFRLVFLLFPLPRFAGLSQSGLFIFSGVLASFAKMITHDLSSKGVGLNILKEKTTISTFRNINTWKYIYTWEIIRIITTRFCHHTYV